MKDIEKGSQAIAAVFCRLVDYYIAKQTLALAVENGFDHTTAENLTLTSECIVAEERIADAVANIAIELA